MKRLQLAMAIGCCLWLVVVGCIGLMLNGCGQGQSVSTLSTTVVRTPAPYFYVISADAPSWATPSGSYTVIDGTAVYLSDPNARVCSGTNDEVEIQAADRAAAVSFGGHGVVKFSPGQFNVSNPGNDDAVSGVADASSADPCVLSNITFDDPGGGAWTIGNVAKGQVYRIYVNGGTDPADADDDILMTVTDKGVDTITMDQKLSQAYETANNICFDRVVGCIKQSNDVVWEGSDAYANTTIKLAASQDCALMIVDNVTATNTQSYVLRNLYFDGSDASQTAGCKTHHGLVYSQYAGAITLSDVGVTDVKGFAVSIPHGHGAHILGDSWFERIDRCALYIGNGDHTGAMIRGGHFSCGVPGSTAILMKAACTVQVMPALVRATGAGSYGIKMVDGCTRNSIVGVYFKADTNAERCLVIDGSHQNTVTGNSFGVSHSDYAMTVAGSIENTIVGNSFDEEGLAGTQPFIELSTTGGAPWYNTIYANGCEQRSVTRRVVRFLNNSGSTIANHMLVSRDITGSYPQHEMTVSAEDGEATVVGVHYGSTTDGKWGTVLVEGYTENFPIEAGDTIVVGDYLAADATDGYGHIAATGETVIAIAMEAENPTTKRTTMKAYIVPEPRFLAP